MATPELIQHLTKEIELATEIQIQQRTKNNLTVAFGPYIVLGGYLVGTKAAPDISMVSAGILWLIFGVFVGVYAFLGYMAAVVEGRLWDQCNKWRALIAENEGISPERMLFDKRGLVGSYLAVYSALAVIFGVVVFLLSKLPHTPSAG